MKKNFFFSFRGKIITAFLLVMALPFLLVGYMAANLMEKSLLQEKEGKLMALARVLDGRLGPGGFAAFLDNHPTAHSREQKIAALNEALRVVTDKVGESSPGVGVGYYSRALDAIVTYGPSASFDYMVGVSIAPDHPGREVMETLKPLAVFGSMVRGDILNAMIPIVRDGESIGYIWANELTTDISRQVAAMTRNVVTFMVFCFGLTCGMLALLSRRTVSDVARIIRGVREMRRDINNRIESSGGELGELVNNINAMAADIARANEETSRALAVFRNVISNLDLAVYVSDPHSMELVYCNDYGRRILEVDQSRGETCHQSIHASSHPCDFCRIPALMGDDGCPNFEPVFRETHNQKLGRDFVVMDRLVTWHDGRILHMQVATDVTERKALAMVEAANQAQRDFLARMSHEIRTPMNGVLGMTHLAMQADPPPAQMEYLKKIQSSASLLLGIINDILDFSRIEAGKMAMEKHVFNVREMVDNLRELVLPRIQEQKLTLTLSIQDSVPENVYGDSLRLSQVLLNLLGNAAKFTQQGEVRLDMSAESLDSGALRLKCRISDTGIGMDEAQMTALFKPFSQAEESTSRRFGGTGLGLSISKALVEMMDGSIEVSSQPGQGSSFSFEVLLGQAEHAPIVPAGACESRGVADYTGKTILVVEDNSINQEIAVAILSDTGASVDVASDGRQAVRAFLEKDYALILMDVRMPHMDGIEATRTIRASDKHDAATVPIIAMTANAMHEDREASKAAGMNGHLAKPIDVDELMRVLEATLHQPC